MSKQIFLSLFLLVAIFYPTKAFAQACELSCPAGYFIAADGKCYTTDKDAKALDPLGLTCEKYPNTTPDKRDIKDVASCICKDPAGVAAVAPAAAAAVPAAKIGYSFGLPCIYGTGVTADPTKKPNPANGYDGFMTAIGCIPSKPDALVAALIKYASFAGGGIAFLLMLLASLQMITAEGNPESIKKAQEKFYSAIIGLLLIIFSVLLMQVIGVDILGLPGFGKQ